MPKNDKLLEIFNLHLEDLTYPHQTHDEFIHNVVADYIFHLMQIGNIPHFLLDIVEIDITQEAMEMYRKKTYGFLTLQNYRDYMKEKNLDLVQNSKENRAKSTTIRQK